MNQTELRDSELTWYYASSPHQICFSCLEHGLGIHAFMPTWPCLIVEFLPIQVKFLEPSGYCTVINCTFTFHTKNVLGCFFNIMDQFELVKHRTTLHVHLCGFLIRYKAMHNMSAYQQQRYYHLQRVATTVWILTVTWYMRRKLSPTKILQNFWLALVLKKNGEKVNAKMKI